MAHSGKSITFAADLLPQDDDVYKLGDVNKRWKIPAATDQAFGTVKIGDGITNTDGVISVTAENLGLSKAMHFIGVATVSITDGGTQDPVISGYNTKTAGDVVIDSASSREYVWSTTNKWELLGGDSSYKTIQTAITAPTATTNKWVSSIGQDDNGVISASYSSLDTSGTWSGDAKRLGKSTAVALNSFTHSTDLIYTYAGGSNGLGDKPSGVDAFGVLSLKTAEGWYGQILVSSNASSGVYWRTATSLSGGWNKILDSSNTYAASSSAVSIPRDTETTIATINGTAVKVKIPALPDNVTRTADGLMSKEDKIKLDDMEVIKGTQTGKTGSWTGTSSVITSLYDGLTIKYYLNRDPSDNASLNLTLADGSTTGAIPCYYNSNRLTTHYAVGSVITLTYFSAGSISVNGTATTNDRWIADANYDSGNTNTILRVYRQTTDYNADYPLLVSRALLSSIGTAGTNSSYAGVYGVVWDDSTKVPTLNPSTGEMKVPGGITAALSGNASTATKFNSTRKIELTGSVTGSATTDGSSGWTISTTTNHTHSYLSTISWSGDTNLKLKQSVNGATATDVLQFVAGSNITLTGASGKLTIAGTANNAVTQSGNTDNKEYSILLKNTNNTTDETAGVKFGKTTNKLVTVNPSTGAITAPGGFIGNADTATQIAAKLAATTKTFLLGTSTTITATAANVDLIGDTLVYLTTVAGRLSAKSYSINDGASTPAEKVYMEWNATDLSLDFIFI